MVVSSQALGLAMRGAQGSRASQTLAVASYTSAASESDWRNSILATDSNLRVKKTGWLFNGVQPDSFPKGPGESAQQSDFVHEHVQWNERVSGQARRVGRMCRRQSMRSPDGCRVEEPIDDPYLVGEEQAEAKTQQS